jgi:hypothetical protein
MHHQPQLHQSQASPSSSGGLGSLRPLPPRHIVPPVAMPSLTHGPPHHGHSIMNSAMPQSPRGSGPPPPSHMTASPMYAHGTPNGTHQPQPQPQHPMAPHQGGQHYAPPPPASHHGTPTNMYRPPLTNGVSPHLAQGPQQQTSPSDPYGHHLHWGGRGTPPLGAGMMRRDSFRDGPSAAPQQPQQPQQPPPPPPPQAQDPPRRSRDPSSAMSFSNLLS